MLWNVVESDEVMMSGSMKIVPPNGGSCANVGRTIKTNKKAANNPVKQANSLRIVLPLVSQ